MYIYIPQAHTSREDREAEKGEREGGLGNRTDQQLTHHTKHLHNQGKIHRLRKEKIGTEKQII